MEDVESRKEIEKGKKIVIAIYLLFYSIDGGMEGERRTTD